MPKNVSVAANQPTNNEARRDKSEYGRLSFSTFIPVLNYGLFSGEPLPQEMTCEDERKHYKQNAYDADCHCDTVGGRPRPAMPLASAPCPSRIVESSCGV